MHRSRTGCVLGVLVVIVVLCRCCVCGRISNIGALFPVQHGSTVRIALAGVNLTSGRCPRGRILYHGSVHVNALTQKLPL